MVCHLFDPLDLDSGQVRQQNAQIVITAPGL